MRAFACFVAALLGLGAGALLIAWAAGWESGGDWSDTRAPHAMWLATLAALGASGLVAAARRNLSETVFSLLTWAGAFLLLILAYSYRDDLTRLWARIRGEVLPAEAVETAAGTVEIRRGRDRHFQVEAEVDGAPVTFLVDTGASGIALAFDDAKAAGIDTASLTFDIPSQAVSGTVMVARTRVGLLRIGPIERRDVEVAVLPFGPNVSLLGQSFLETLASFEVNGDRMILRD